MLNHILSILYFSNENYKEVATEHLKYFMLPVLLGDMNSRLLSSLLYFLFFQDIVKVLGRFLLF